MASKRKREHVTEGSEENVDFLEVNVGGRIFEVRRSTLYELVPDSALAKMFNPSHRYASGVQCKDRAGRPFLCRNGDGIPFPTTV